MEKKIIKCMYYGNCQKCKNQKKCYKDNLFEKIKTLENERFKVVEELKK